MIQFFFKFWFAIKMLLGINVDVYNVVLLGVFLKKLVGNTANNFNYYLDLV